MKTDVNSQQSFDEIKSLQVIKDMIEVSRNNFKNDGILFIIWGWIFFVSVFCRYLTRKFIFPDQIASYVNKSIILLFVIGLIITFHHLYKRQKLVKTYTGQMLQYLWGAILAINIYILIYQLSAGMQIDMLYTQYMLMLALGTFVTSGIIRYRPMILTSLSFIVLAQIGIFFTSETVILLASFSFITGLALPGHLLFLKRNK